MNSATASKHLMEMEEACMPMWPALMGIHHWVMLVLLLNGGYRAPGFLDGASGHPPLPAGKYELAGRKPLGGCRKAN
jgi:hypothetical protein